MQYGIQGITMNFEVGPFVGTDGITALGSVAPGSLSTVLAVKYGITLATFKTITLGAAGSLNPYIQLSSGRGKVQLNANDLPSLGDYRLTMIAPHTVPAWEDIIVTTQQRYDELFGADRYQVDVREYGDANLNLTTGMKNDIGSLAVLANMESSLGVLNTKLGSLGYLVNIAGSQGYLPNIVGSLGYLPNISGSLGWIPNISGSLGYLTTITGSLGYLLNIVGSLGYLPNILGSMNVLGSLNAWQTAALAELGIATPSATPDIKNALMLLYMIARNKLTVTSTELDITNNAGTVIAKKALSDDSTTFTEDEMASG